MKGVKKLFTLLSVGFVGVIVLPLIAINLTSCSEKYNGFIGKADGTDWVGHTSGSLISNNPLCPHYIIRPDAPDTIEYCDTSDPFDPEQISNPAYRSLHSDDIKFTANGLTIPARVRLNNKVYKVAIGRNAFMYNLSNFFSISGKLTITDGITIIKENAFTDLGITEVDLPKSISVIGDNAFDGCRLEKIHLSQENPYFQMASSNTVGNASIVISKNYHPNNDFIWNSTTPDSPIGCLAAGQLSVPCTTQEIAPRQFEGCAGLTKVRFENATSGDGKVTQSTTIGADAFAYCSGIKAAEDKRIDEVFALNAEQLKRYGWASGRSVGDDAWVLIERNTSAATNNADYFNKINKSGDKSGDVGSPLFVDNDDSDDSDDKLPGEPNFSTSAHSAYDFLYSEDFPVGGIALGALVIPPWCTSIQKYAFYATGIKSVNLGDIKINGNGNAIISDSAFEGCTNLETLSFNNKLSESNQNKVVFQSNAFFWCINLKKINIEVDGESTLINGDKFEGSPTSFLHTHYPEENDTLNTIALSIKEGAETPNWVTTIDAELYKILTNLKLNGNKWIVADIPLPSST